MSKSKAAAAAEPVVINDTNLSRAWSRAFLAVLHGRGTEISPLILSITGFAEDGTPCECPAVRNSLDQLLKHRGRTSVDGIAFAIFPQYIWTLSHGDRARLFHLYRATLPRLKAMNRRANGRGMYFERLTMYDGGRCGGNQLEWILSQPKGVRRSMLQATIFDARRDHSPTAQLGFPCLQHVSFEPTTVGLVVNAFYATQQLFDKAYGNYLGLAHLGGFMAHEMKLPLARVNVMVGVAKLERVNKSDSSLRSVIVAAKALTATPDGSGTAASHHGNHSIEAPSAPPGSTSSSDANEPTSASPSPPSTTHPRLFQTEAHDAPSAPVSPPIVLRHLAPATVSPVYDSYWRFAARRQDIFFRRLRGQRPPWTDDPVLATYKFTNAYRASDRVSQYLIRHVIYRADLPRSAREVVFRVLLFKMFNKIATWELLERSLGPITLEDYRFRHYDQVLSRAMRRGDRIYSAAYIMPPGTRAFGASSKHQNHLLLIEHMIRTNLPDQLAQARTMQEGFEILRGYPTIGDFLAYQFITDINYSEITGFSEMDFVIPGPGARDGLRKCFVDPGGLSEPELIKLMTDLQESEFERLSLSFQSLWGRRLQLIDCQNLFCEVDKYARVAHPEISGLTGRTRIKQRFTPQYEPIAFFYPPKWQLSTSESDGVTHRPAV